MNLKRQTYAFPLGGQPGMTLRDYFAAAAMQAIQSRAIPPSSGDSNEHIARLAYATADAMLQVRDEDVRTWDNYLDDQKE